MWQNEWSIFLSNNGYLKCISLNALKRSASLLKLYEKYWCGLQCWSSSFKNQFNTYHLKVHLAASVLPCKKWTECSVVSKTTSKQIGINLVENAEAMLANCKDIEQCEGL